MEFSYKREGSNRRGFILKLRLFASTPTLTDRKMNITSTLLFLCVVICGLMARVQAGGGHGGHHVVIKIPEHIHTVKHTHTVYKTIHHGHGGGGHEDHHSHGGKPFHWH